MNDLIILHLSDLHIDNNGHSFSKSHVFLLNDIKEQLEYIQDKRLVIVITGDIIHKGNPDSLGNAKKFFQELKNIVNQSIVAIYIIPGNHDKNRDKINSFLISSYRHLLNKCDINTFDSDYKDNIWHSQQESYEKSKYLELIKYIYDDLFSMQDIGKILKKTYGVHVIKVNSKKYCFVMLNTAWSCMDDFETRKLILGKFQLDEINYDFHKLTDGENIDLTFVMGHHPIESLHGIEQDALFENMISFNGMAANAYLCGHIHDRDVINWSNSRHAIHTLMTGFGWPENFSSKHQDRYYSLYKFNLELNSMDIYVRRTNNGKDFIPDLSIYKSTDSKNEKITRPIIFHENQNTIMLSMANELPPKTAYLSSSFLTYSKEFLVRLYDLSIELTTVLEEIKSNLYNNLLLPENLSKDDHEELYYLLSSYLTTPDILSKLTSIEQNIIKNTMIQNEDRLFEYFQSFIQRICHRFRDELVEDVKENQIVRFHCRFLSDKDESIYSTLCTSFSTCDQKIDNDNQPSTIRFCDLLEATFNSSTSGCLIYSINKEICKNKLKDKWADYITVIPKFTDNIYRKIKYKNIIGNYPFLTFGVTINDTKYSNILQCIDYYKLDRYIGGLLQRYINIFQIDINRFIEWIKTHDKTQEGN